MAKFSIILPTYNERENVHVCLYLIDKHMKASGHDYEVIVVDDNSPDGTQDVIKKLQGVFGTDHVARLLISVLANDMQQILKPRAGKLGLGTAYIHGLQFATGDFVVLMDADLSHHPKYLPQMIEMQQANNYDLVSGTRYDQGGGVCGWDLGRKITSRGANLLAQLLLQPNVSDLTGSYRLYKRAVFDNIIREVTSKGYAFQMEIIVRARYKGYSIGEVPIVFVDRFFGESKLGKSEIVGFLKGLVKLFFTL